MVQRRNITMCGVNFWKNKYDIDVKNRFATATYATKESRLRLLHFKILHNIYPTNILLNRMKIRESELCETCRTKDYIEHFFVNCKLLRGFWSHVQNTILEITNSHYILTEQTILMGLEKSAYRASSTKTDIANHILLIAKMSISKMRYRSEHYVKDIFRIFEAEMALREKLI